MFWGVPFINRQVDCIPHCFIRQEFDCGSEFSGFFWLLNGLQNFEPETVNLTMFNCGSTFSATHRSLSILASHQETLIVWLGRKLLYSAGNVGTDVIRSLGGDAATRAGISRPPCARFHRFNPIARGASFIFMAEPSKREALFTSNSLHRTSGSQVSS